MIELSDEEKAFLLEILDQVNVRGIAAKTMLIVIMGKLMQPEPKEEA